MTSRPAFWDAFGGGGNFDEQAVVARMDAEIKRSPVLMYSRTTCPFCIRAKAELDAIGATYTVVELDRDADGQAIRTCLKKRVGRTSVPSIFVKGQWVGGMDDGGTAGGLKGLKSADMLVPMLKRAGAVKRGFIESRTPLAPLFGNNLRDALSSLGGTDDS